MEKLTVIVPCFNEEASLSESYLRTKKVLDSIKDFRTEIMYVNDGSQDKTREILNTFAATDPTVKVLHFSRNFGHQSAVSAGIKYCDSDWAIIMDADLQDPPELIPEIMDLCKKENANCVYCVRKSREKEGWFKQQTARLFYRTMNKMSEVEFPVDTGDFRLIDRKIIDEFNNLPEHGKYIRGLVSWIGFKQIPFYYERKARIAGQTKYPLKKMIGFASTALLYFSKKPLQIVIGLGFLAVLVGVFLAIWVLFGKFLGFSNAETGWTSIITIVVFFGGVQLLTIGVLGQYIGVLFDEIKNRPEYIVDEMKNFN